MSQSLVLSRYRLQTFATCQRKFQLGSVSDLPWPSQPVDPKLQAAFQRGEAFHRLLEQHFLGMGIELDDAVDDAVRGWWHTFQANPPVTRSRATFPEASLTVPLGGHLLFGRFDLLVLGDNSAHIFDWKTERRPRKAYELREDWQTRLYLALLAEGAGAFGRNYAPDQIALTYWFANAPEQSVTIQYDAGWHQRNWAVLTALIGRIERRMVASNAIWPLTDDLDECAKCGFRAYCGRDVAPVIVESSDLEMQLEADSAEIMLEPPTP